MELFLDPVKLLIATAKDVLPVLALLVLFQVVVLRQPLPRLGRILFGFTLVLVGMACFLGGLDLALFPVGRAMAMQLSAGVQAGSSWTAYGWIYLFAFLVGFSTTIAEPSLIAVAHKAEEASYKAVSATGLRIAVAFGVAVGITLGTFRIVTGTPLYLFILFGYVIVAVQTWFAPRMIIPASGTGAGEAKTFFGLSLDIRTELVLFVVHESIVDAILSAIREAGRFSEPGTGIAMVLPVEQTTGMESQESRRQR